jgi:hypothetical protein
MSTTASSRLVFARDDPCFNPIMDGEIGKPSMDIYIGVMGM